ncbi:methionine ABC transporter ATP-binding protein [Brevibacterium samyangense]|uniref:Methionine ABC transporter ATP-binding protein n=1 Tax=Brevibacterium samyangense TaxID=366888 RepID=A0ABN2T768_9MICO
MIELRALRKEFSGVVALESIDLSVPAGRIHGIVGRSGAGKSTLIRCLTGLETPTSGTVSIAGEDLTGRSSAALRKARRNIGMVFQHANLLDSRTALENVEHPLQIAGVSRAQRRSKALELLELVGLADRAQNHPAQLSGGQKQRVGIARALAADPQILLCDEPTSALDSRTTRQILELIRDLRDRLGITVLIITHEMSVVREICDSVTLLQNGRVARTGSLAEVVREGTSDLSRELLPLPPHTGTDSASTLEVFLADRPVTDLLAVLTDAPGAEVTAGSIETLAGSRVGRLRLQAPDAAGAEALATALRTAGFGVETLGKDA